MHVSELGEDYPVRQRQAPDARRAQRQTLRLGDRLRVRSTRADLESGRIDFVLARSAAGGASRIRAPETSVSAGRQQLPARQTCGGCAGQGGETRRSNAQGAAGRQTARRLEGQTAKPAKPAPRRAGQGGQERWQVAPQDRRQDDGRLSAQQTATAKKRRTIS